jgi:hypothetical protein
MVATGFVILSAIDSMASATAFAEFADADLMDSLDVSLAGFFLLLSFSTGVSITEGSVLWDVKEAVVIADDAAVIMGDAVDGAGVEVIEEDVNGNAGVDVVVVVVVVVLVAVAVKAASFLLLFCRKFTGSVGFLPSCIGTFEVTIFVAI